MPHRKSSSKTLYVVVLLFILMVLVKSYFALKIVNPSVLPDEAVYNDIAKNIAVGKFTSDIQYAQIYPSGYPLFLSLASVSADAERVYHLMLIINCILSSSIIFPAFFILKKFIHEEEALYFSLAASCLPSIVVYFPLILSENLFSPLFLFSAWFLLESISRKSLLFDFLSGFSLFLLLLTRSIGAAFLPGLVLALIYKIKLSKDSRYSSVLRSGGVMLLSFLLPFSVWYYYKTSNAVPQLSIKEFSDVSSYNIPFYVKHMSSAFSNITSFTTFLNLFIHETDYLILTTYFAFFIFASYSIYKWHSLANSSEYLLFISYTIISSILTTFITTVHMYAAVLLGNDNYYLFGRYLDPLVAPLFIMGVVGIYQFQKNKERKPAFTADSYLLTGLYLLVLFTFVYTFPYTTNFSLANLLAAAYLAVFTFSPLFFTIASLSIFLFILLMPRNEVFTKTLLVFIILVSLLISSFTFLWMYPQASDRENQYRVARYLQNYASADTLTLFDSKRLDDTQNFVWFPITFWSKSRLMLYPLNSFDICHSGIKADYIVSNKTLSSPYENVTSDGAYNLYRINCG